MLIVILLRNNLFKLILRLIEVYKVNYIVSFVLLWRNLRIS